MLAANNAAIPMITRSKRKVLEPNAPNMLRSGRRNNSAGKIMVLGFNPARKCICVSILLLRSFLRPTRKIANVEKVIVTVKGTVDNGLETPKSGYKPFTSNPVNIKKAILKLTESKNEFIALFSFSFKTPRMTNPGMNVI